MNETIVIYESKYGFTKQYANWISQALSCPVLERRQVHSQDLEQADVILYGGGLYAGGVSGIKLITQNWELLSHKKVVLFTCGLADPKNPVNVKHIHESLSKVLSPEIISQIQIFHFQGGMDYSRLKFVHRSMMAMLRKMLLKKKEDDLTSEDRELLATYGKAVDFTDPGSIRPLLDYLTSDAFSDPAAESSSISSKSL